MAGPQALIRRETPGAMLAPQSFQEALAFAERIATTDFVPQAMRGNAGAVLAAVQYGAELGIGPMQALNGLIVIHGNVGMKVEMMLALVINHPELETLDRAFDPETLVATVVIQRRGRSQRTVTFGPSDAERVSVKENDKWIPLSQTGRYRAWPQRMYPARALGFAIRDEFPDVMRGMRTAEEIEVIDASVVTAQATEALATAPIEDVWAWVPVEVQPTVKEAFDQCALPPAKQRVLLFQFKAHGYEALLEYLRSEYAARHGRKRATKVVEVPETKAPTTETTSDPVVAETPSPATEVVSDRQLDEVHAIADTHDTPPQRKTGQPLLTAEDIPWGGQ